jgi:tetratricopeptide (TPR) repeat protein
MPAALVAAPVNAMPVDDAFDAHRAWIGAAVILALTLIAYFPAMQAGYIWDDDQYVSENRLLRQGWDGLRDIWTPRKTPQYYPIVFTTFWLEHQVWGLNPHGYHIVNILLHALNAMLVWRLARMLRLPWAWLIGAIFALHPVHVESVAWITERKNTLSALFYLLAAMTYLEFDRDRISAAPVSRWGMYALSLTLLVLALLSKSVTCSLPAALILMMLWQRKPLTISRLAPLVPLFVIGLWLALHTARVEREHVGAFGEDFDFSTADRIIIASRALLFYAGKIIWPWPIIFTYPRWALDDGDVIQYLWPAVVIVLAVGLLVLYLRGIRGPGLAIAFFAGTVFPALGFVNIYPMMFSFVADHFQYLASLGIIALAVALIRRVVQTRERMVLASVAVLAPLGMITFWQAGAYEDAETLYRDTIAKNPDAFMAHNNLAAELLRQAEMARDSADEARVTELEHNAADHLREALRIKPRYPQALQNMSDLLSMHGQNHEALKLARLALEIITARPDIQSILTSSERPQFAPISDAFAAVARLEARTGGWDKARHNYAEAVAWNPGDLSLRSEFAEALLLANDLDAAAIQYERILAIDPRGVTAMANLASVREKQGRFAEARGLLDRALATASPDADGLAVYLRLVRLLANSPDPAVRDTRQAVAMMRSLVEQTRRSDPALLDVLSSVLAQDGQIVEAIATGNEAAALAQRMGLDELEQQIRIRVAALQTSPSSTMPK